MTLLYFGAFLLRNCFLVCGFHWFFERKKHAVRCEVLLPGEINGSGRIPLLSAAGI